MSAYRIPFIEANVVSIEGNRRIPLSIKNASQGAQNFVPAFISDINTLPVNFELPFITAVKIDNTLSMLPKIQLTLSPDFKSAINILNSPVVEYLINRLDVKIGYLDGDREESDVFSGLLGFPSVTLNDSPTIQLIASGSLGLALSEQETSVKGSVIEVIEQLIKLKSTSSYRLFYNGQPIEEVKPLLAVQSFGFYSDLEKNLFGKQVTINLKGASLFEIIDTETRRVGAYIRIYADPKDNTIQIVDILPIEKLYSTTVVTKLFSFNDPGFRFNNGLPTYPIFEFSGNQDSTANYLPRGRGVYSNSIDSLTRKPKKLEAKDSKNAAPRVGAEGQGATPIATSYVGNAPGYLPIDSNDPRAQDKLEAEFYTSQLVVKVNIQTIGLPNLRIGERIRVEGASIRFDGEYIVMSYTHTVDNSGFSTSFEAYSNTAKQDANYTEPAKRPAVDGIKKNLPAGTIFVSPLPNGNLA